MQGVNISTLTLWGLLQSVTSLPQPQYDLAKVRALVPSSFSTSSNNEFWERQRSEAFALEPGLRATVEISKRHKDGAIGLFIVNLEYSQCITRDALKLRFPDLKLFMPANNPAPGAVSSWHATLNKRTVSFGFRNQDFECLSSVGVSFEVP